MNTEKAKQVLSNRISVSVYTILIVAAIGAAWIFLELKPRWEAAARTGISREEVEATVKAKDEKIAELTKEKQQMEERRQEDARIFDARLVASRKRITQLEKDLQNAIAEGKRNEKLLARLRGYELFEYILDRTNELWNKYDLRVPEPGSD